MNDIFMAPTSKKFEGAYCFLVIFHPTIDAFNCLFMCSSHFSSEPDTLISTLARVLKLGEHTGTE